VAYLKPKALTEALRAALAGGPRTQDELYAAVSPKGHTLAGSHFFVRLKSRVKNGLLAKLLVKGTNQYLLTEQLLGAEREFDLSDPAARLVAADWLEERGQPELARLLRQARRFTCGAEKGAGP
jgi:uncharacterized protein (TIGR02996 family)